MPAPSKPNDGATGWGPWLRFVLDSLWDGLAGAATTDQVAGKVDSGTFDTRLATKADLVNGRIPNGQLPVLSFGGSRHDVANQAAMLALTGLSNGDWAVWADGSVYLYAGNGANPASAGSWTSVEKSSASNVTSIVTSSGTYTGQVTLSAATFGAVDAAKVGAANGVAALGSDGKVPPAQLPATGVSSVAGRSGAVTLTAADAGAVSTSAVGAASGVAPLGADSKVPAANLPTTVNTVAGRSGNVTLTAGDVGAVDAATRGQANGVAPLGSDGKVPPTCLPPFVVSVNGRSGVVTLTPTDIPGVALATDLQAKADKSYVDPALVYPYAAGLQLAVGMLVINGTTIYRTKIAHTTTATIDLTKFDAVTASSKQVLPTVTAASVGWDTTLNGGAGGWTYGAGPGSSSPSATLGALIATDPAVFAGSGFAPLVADGWEQTTTTGTDNTASWNWLIGQARTTGKPIILPSCAPGRAYAHDGIVDASGVTIIGQNSRYTVITQRTKTNPVLIYGGTDCTLQNVFLSRPARNFLTDRSSADVTANTQKNLCGLRIGRAGIGCRIWDVNIWRSTAGVWCQENLDSSSTTTTYLANADIRRLHIGQLSTGGYGFYLNGTAGSTTFVIENCYVSNGDNQLDVMAAGYYFANLDELRFQGNNFEWTTAKDCLVIGGVAATSISNFHVEGYKAGADDGAGVHILPNGNAKYLRWENINFKNCKFDKTYNAVTKWSLVKAERGVDIDLAGLQTTTGTETAAAGNQSALYFVSTTNGVTRPMIVSTRSMDTKSPGLTWSGHNVATVGTGGSVGVRDLDQPPGATDLSGVPAYVRWDGVTGTEPPRPAVGNTRMVQWYTPNQPANWLAGVDAWFRTP